MASVKGILSIHFSRILGSHPGQCGRKSVKTRAAGDAQIQLSGMGIENGAGIAAEITDEVVISNGLPYTKTARSSVREARWSAAPGNYAERVLCKTGGKYSAACGFSVCRHIQNPGARC